MLESTCDQYLLKKIHPPITFVFSFHTHFGSPVEFLKNQLLPPFPIVLEISFPSEKEGGGGDSECLLSGTIPEKPNEQRFREMFKCQFWVPKCPIYLILGKTKTFLKKVLHHFFVFIET